MELILASEDGREKGYLHNDIDIDIGKDNDFELTVPYLSWNGEIQDKSRIYVPNTEFGGLAEEVDTSSKNNTLCVRGYTWRGLLDKYVVGPESGEDYLVLNGELNACIRLLIEKCNIGRLFQGSYEDTGISISNVRFRYVTLLDALSSFLKGVNYKLVISYKQTQSDGYVELSAAPVVNLSDEHTVSSDSSFNFDTKDYKRGINHLICLGKGELAARQVVHLYADVDGNISYTKSQFGINERVEIYDYPNVDSEAELAEAGIQRLKELLNYKDFKVSLNEIDSLNIDIGDLITGIDYITGITVTKPVVNKIFKLKSGVPSVEYKIEGE